MIRRMHLCLLLCLSSSSALGQDHKPAREFYLPVTVEGTGAPLATARAVDFAELLAAAGESRAADPASIRVWQVDQAGKPVQQARWNYRPDAGQLVWAVPPIRPQETAEYRVYFQASDGGPSASPPDASKDPALLPNLFVVGDFESPTPCWLASNPAQRDTQVVHSGQASLRMGGGKGTSVQLGRNKDSLLCIQAQRAYRASMVLKSSGRLLRTIAVHYYDQAGKTLRKDMVSSLLRSKGLGGHSDLDKKSYDWTPVAFTVKAPAGAVRMDLSFVLLGDDAGGAGSLWVDDVRVEPLDLDELVQIVDSATGQSYSTAVAAVEGLKCFDFGPADAPVFEHFTAVSDETLYDRARGFGFKDKSQKARNGTYPEPLSCDLVACDGARKSTFLVDLRDGDYGVWVLSGVNSAGYYETRCPYQIRVSGGDALAVEPTAANYHQQYMFRAYYDFLSHDDGLPVDVYDRYFRPLFREKVLAAKVRGGQLAVEIVPGKAAVPSSAGFLNALVIWPAAKAKEAQAWLEWVARKRARLGQIKEIVEPDPAPEPAPTRAETDRGYILFTQPWSTVFRPNTRPLEQQKLGPLRVVAISGQWEPAALCLYPLQELGDCRVTVGDLAGPEGQVLPASSVQVSVVRFFACRAQATSKTYAIDGYRREGQLVMPGDTASAHAGASRQFLLTVTARGDLPKGIYRGHVRVTPQKGKPADVELAVLVIPLAILPPPGWHTSFRYTFPGSYDSYPFPEMAPAAHQMHVAELRHMQHFRNTAAMVNIGSWAWVEGAARRPVLDATRVNSAYGLNAAKMDTFLKWFKDDIVSAYQEARITETPVFFMGPVPQHGEVDPQRYQAGQEFLKAMFAGCQDLPLRLIYDLGGEWSNDGERGGRKARLVYSWAKQAIPGIVTGSTLNGQYCLEAVGYLDYVSLRTYLFSDALVRRIHDTKGEAYVYGYPDRFSNGLYLWRVGAKGNYLTEYYTRAAHGELFNDFDTPYADLAWSHALPSPDGPVPRVLLYSRAAGFLDALTLYTLEALAAKAAASNSDQARQLAAEAQRFLDELRAGIPDEYKKIEELGLRPTAESMDKTRLAAALKAYDLQQALQQGK